MKKNEKRIGELLDKYGERIRVLKRRGIENYFIDCYKEIAKVINKHHDNMVATPQEIEQYVMDYLSQTENEYLYRTKQIDKLDQILGGIKLFFP
jgi:hypothetical protein